MISQKLILFQAYILGFLRNDWKIGASELLRSMKHIAPRQRLPPYWPTVVIERSTSPVILEGIVARGLQVR